MKIAIALTPPTELHFKWAAQIGVTDFVCRYPRHYGIDPIDGLSEMRDRAGGHGLQTSVVEGYLPIDEIVRGASGRDERVEEITKFIRHMGKLGVGVLCYNFMHADWTRTNLRVPARGGALTNRFDLKELGARAALLPGDRRVSSSSQVWDNLAWFLKRIVPVAEDAGVQLAMHPDDPPLPEIAGAAQVMYDAACFERLFDLAPSKTNGMCFCQGTFAEMGADIPQTIRRFKDRIHYVHFRDVRATSASNFVETFHDEGQTDMPAAMRAYQSIGFTGCARPDHVPKLEGEEGEGSGYTMLGRLFAVGYMRGLIHATYGRDETTDEHR